MTRLLISVRSAAEAAMALEGGADVIDMKEPGRGSLGCCDTAVWRQVCRYVGGRRLLSAALGELIDGPLRCEQVPPAGLDFVKIGLAGCQDLVDWQERWSSALQQLPAHVGRVAVAYADFANAHAPPPEVVWTAAVAQGCRALLLDTYGKQSGGLFDHLHSTDVRTIVDRVQEQGLWIVLAGGLDLRTLAQALDMRPDYVAVRGGVCRGDRQGTIDAALVRCFADRVAGASAPQPARLPAAASADRAQGSGKPD